MVSQWTSISGSTGFPPESLRDRRPRRRRVADDHGPAVDDPRSPRDESPRRSPPRRPRSLGPDAVGARRAREAGQVDAASPAGRVEDQLPSARSAARNPAEVQGELVGPGLLIDRAEHVKLGVGAGKVRRRGREGEEDRSVKEASRLLFAGCGTTGRPSPGTIWTGSDRVGPGGSRAGGLGSAPAQRRRRRERVGAMESWRQCSPAGSDRGNGANPPRPARQGAVAELAGLAGLAGLAVPDPADRAPVLTWVRTCSSSPRGSPAHRR